ncbi:J-domain-containing protein [Modestobacter versicolor]|uniref:DnaJ family domain-containing protein n=1 Tax=Modestobacter versicolor TaxID=429133 RepID=UPI0034E0330F
MTERKPQGMTFETWVEQQIRRAADEGAFEDLSLSGKPLPRRDRDKTSYEWALEWARREEADVAAMLPTGLALRKEREELPGRVAAQTSEDAVRALVEAHNDRVDQYYRRPVDGVWVPVGMADVEEVVAGWRRSRPSVPPPVPPSAQPPGPPAAPPSRRRGWWRRRAG